MGEWRRFRLEEITENYDELRKPIKESDRSRGPYPYYGASGVIDYVDGFLFDGDYLLVAEDGENLRTRKTPIAFLARGRFWVNNHAHVVRGGYNSDTRFLLYALNGSDISGYLTGAVMPKLTQSNLNKIELNIPPLNEQLAISHVLGVLDDKIELNRKQNETLEAMARAMFKAWFVDFEPVRAKMEGRWKRGQSLPGMPAHLYDLFPDRMVESELGEIPEGWEVRSLDSIANYLNGLALQKYPPESENEFLPVIKIAQLRSGDTHGAGRASARISPEYVVENGDVLFSWSGSLEVEVWSGGRGALNQHLFKVTSGLFPKWFYYFATRHHLPTFREIAAGKATTMGHIQRKHLTASKVVIPSMEDMNRIDSVIAPLFEKLTYNAKQSRLLVQLRDSLLPDLVSGDLRVRNPGRLLENMRRL